MVSKEELEAIGISSEDSNRNNIVSSVQVNTVAKIIKIIAIIEAIVGTIFGMANIDGGMEEFIVPIIIFSIVSAVFIYAIGEIIQLLEDIKNK